MPKQSSSFLAKSAVKSSDRSHRQKINFNIGRYNAVVPNGKAQFTDVSLVREKAKNIKWKAISRLDEYLEQFESKITAAGAKVLWAETSDDALSFIREIVSSKNCRTVVKSKSMVTEEIHLNRFLEQMGLESVETDLGEYIQQLSGEAPYHIVTPAMHKSKQDVARLFAKELGTPPDLSPGELTLVAREKLREKYVRAEVGITGANFIVADTGSIALTENEGNGRLTTAWPKTHIVVCGIEKMIPSIKDLAVLWPLLATYGTGQQMTVYSSIFSGPKSFKEQDGPEEMYVILLDNGRTNLLANPQTREALYCIRCGACLNACPVYKNIGGHSYEATYSGPIGSVITPHLKDRTEWKHLSYASSLCGNCTEVCAVKINLHELLLENRKISVKEGDAAFSERMAWKFWKKAMLNRKLMNKGTAPVKNWVVNTFVPEWKKDRVPLKFPQKSFNQLWQEKKK